MDQRVHLKVSEGCIIIEPADKVEYELDALLSGITSDNAHDETDFGAPVGKEAL